MPDTNMDTVRSQVFEALNLKLSDEEVEALLTDGNLSFEKLAQNRSLSEIGTALIRADTFNLHLNSKQAAFASGNAKKEFCFGEEPRRICIHLGIGLRLNPHKS